MKHTTRFEGAASSAQRRWQPVTWLTLLMLVLAIAVPAALAAPAPQEGQPPDSPPPAESQERLQPVQSHPANDDPEAAYSPDYVKIASGALERAPEVTRYAWPFNLNAMGHTIASYQYYGGSPYFHHGLDILANSGTGVYSRSGGQVVNVENYQPGNDLYWEVAVLDPEGYIWQYHHIEVGSIPQGIWDKWYEYQANPTTGGFIAPNTYIGNIVYWPVVTFGERFNHIHLNILGAGGAYVNGFAFHTLLNDTAAPQIQAIGLLQNNSIVSGSTVTGSYGMYVRARDLILHTAYYVPPYEIKYSVDGGPEIVTWRFDNLPGGADRYAYISQFFVPPTCGNYSCRDFYINIGFTTTGNRSFPSVGGQHTILVTVTDDFGNQASQSYTWTVNGPTVTPTSTPTQTPTATPTWTATAAPPTDTPVPPPTHTPVPPTDTPVPPTDTPVPPPTDTPVAPAPTDTPVSPTDTPVPPTDTPVPPTDTPVPPTDTPTPLPPTETPTPAPPTATPTPATDNLIYIGSTTGGTAGGAVSFADEDILVRNQTTGDWSLAFDGSDVGLGGADISGFVLQPDGSILLSFSPATSVAGLGTVDDSDVVRFVPTSLGSNTAGSFQWYFDGSDVGLSTSSEVIDALAVTADGKLIFSTTGSFSVSGASGNDEDLLIFTPAAMGQATSGSWALYFDGSDVGLSSTSNEDVNGVWVDPASGQIFLTTLGAFSVSGVSGDGADIFICTPGSLGAATACSFSMYWDGSANGFAGEVVDTLAILR